MCSPAKTWTVVCFESDNSVQAVPTGWISGDNCLWPSLPQGKLNHALKQCDYNSCWPSHKVRLFRNATYDDYYVARTKAAKAEYSSDLNSDTEARMKRVRRKRIISSESDEEDSMIEPKKRKHLSLPTPPQWNNEDDATEIIRSPNLASRDESFSARSFGHQEELGTIQEIGRITKETGKQVLKESPMTQCGCNPKILYNIQSLLMDVNSKVEKLLNNYQSIAAKENNSQEENGLLQRSGIDFPIKNDNSLNDMEQLLTSPENYKSLVLFLSKMGGCNLYEFIKRCLREILDDTIAMQYSYMGRKGKKKFCSLTLAKAVIESAEKSGISKDRKETEVTIGLWLRKAKFRNNRQSKI